MELVCLISGRSSHLFEVKVYKVIFVWIRMKECRVLPASMWNSKWICLLYNILQHASTRRATS